MGNLLLDFDRSTLPWIDRPDSDIDSYVSAISALPRDYDLHQKLTQWKKDGYVVFERAVSSELVDAYLADVAEFIARHKEFSTMITSHAYGNVEANRMTREQFDEPLMRICDLHNNSVAGKVLGLNSKVVSFLSHVFQDTVVMMQSLTFLRSSEQDVHQDYAYVVSMIPSHLAACWIALEDVSPDAGPLSYYPGSHRIAKFDFGNGLCLTSESTFHEGEFSQHIRAECAKMGLKEVVFLPRKGDMFVWHSALAHGGTSMKNRALTRRSFVCHYSSRSGYPADRRNTTVSPKVYEYDSGLVYGNPLHPDEEDLLKRGLKPDKAKR